MHRDVRLALPLLQKEKHSLELEKQDLVVVKQGRGGQEYNNYINLSLAFRIPTRQNVDNFR